MFFSGLSCPSLASSCFSVAFASARALQPSYASLACNGLAVVIGLIIAIAVGSPAVLAFSFENLIDLASSLLLVWRFAGGGTGKTAAALETHTSGGTAAKLPSNNADHDHGQDMVEPGHGVAKAMRKADRNI